MSSKVTKRFSTVETVTKLLQYRNIMFNIIESADKERGTAVVESDFYRHIADYSQNQSKEVARDIALVFDIDNLLQAKVINDRKSAAGTTKLWFNSTVVDLFRLCKISLYRPLNKTALLSSMTPIWSIITDLNEQKLSITPGTDDYADWTDEINHRITELLGKIKANISKLERLGEQFENNLEKRSDDYSADVVKLQFNEAARLYRREIEPLSTFLDKNTRYEKGDGIILALSQLRSAFSRIGDLDNESLINRYQLQYLDLFQPIKKVADNVSIYLRKTKSAIIEHNAIESAFSVIRAAYEKTLSADQRFKYISANDLQGLGEMHPFDSIERVSPLRLDKNPAFLNNVFNELASRTAKNAQTADTSILFEESISREQAQKLRHSMRITDWVNQHDWPTETDYIAHAFEQLHDAFDGFSIPDLIEIGDILHSSGNYKVEPQFYFASIETAQHKMHYRVRFLLPASDNHNRKATS